jgi:DNA-binding winged helix-turn-helix (wHTH) protein
VASRRLTPAFRFGSFTLIPTEGLLLKDGEPVPLARKAFDLLAFLSANPDRLLTKAELMQAVWPNAAVEESNLAYNVFAIRKAFGESADADQYIETVPTRGYRFIAPVVRTNGDDSAGSSRSESDVDSTHAHEPLDASGVHATVDSVRFQDPVVARLAESGMFAVSPDGRHLVFGAEGPDGTLRLWVRTMSRLEPFPLPGTDVFTILPPMFWSPDSRFIGFQAGGHLKIVSLSGGAPQVVCDLNGAAVGGSWNRDNVILIGNALGGVLRCPAAGGVTTPVTAPAESEIDLYPSFLSDGRHFLFLRVSRSRPERSGIYVRALDAPPDLPAHRLIATGFGAAFVPATDSAFGFVMFAQDGALYAQRFDERPRELTGQPVRVAESVGSYLDGAFFSASSTTLVHRAPDPNFQLTWFSRHGHDIGRVGEPGRFVGLALSPNGNRALVAKHVPQSTVDQDLWLFDLTRDAMARRMTFEPTLEFWPVWATDDRFVFGCGGGESGIYEQTLCGRRRLFLQTGTTEIPTCVTSDLQMLLYATVAEPAMGWDVWVQLGQGESAIRTPFIRREFDQRQAVLSSDGRWVAYVSNENGPNEVFVAEFQIDTRTGAVSAGESVPVSQGGGFSPRWRGDTRELFYLMGDGSVMSVDVDTTPVFRPGRPRQLFRVAGVIPEWGVTTDGSRFLFAVPVSSPPPFNIVRDWQAALSKWHDDHPLTRVKGQKERFTGKGVIDTALLAKPRSEL